MERDKLYAFFAGLSSLEEGMAIKRWVEESPANRETLYRERRLFDAVNLHTVGEVSLRKKHSKQSRRLSVSLSTLLKVAATVLLTLTLNHLYNSYEWVREDVAMNIVSSPAGQRTHIVLPDGSSVWLNARSTLKYPSSFNKSHRTLSLEGEALFDVVKKEGSHFMVQTEKYAIEVLGTQFGVRAYPCTETFETTLMSGSVKIISLYSKEEPILLEPHHKAYLADGKLAISKVTDYHYYRWTEGLICFQEADFQTVIRRLEECYGMQIVISNRNLSTHTFTGKFRQTDGIEYALRVLQKSVNFSFSRDDAEPIIYIN